MVESRAKMPCMIPEHTRNEAPANFGLRPGTVWSHVRKGFLFTALASVYSEKPRAAPARFQAARQRREIRRCDQGWFAVWNTPGVRFRVNVKGKIIRKVPQFSAAADFFKGMARAWLRSPAESEREASGCWTRLSARLQPLA
jgi:hypothetical protein